MNEAENATHLTAAGTYTIFAADPVGATAAKTIPVHALRSVLVGTGGTAATVTVRYADDDEVISIIDAATPSIGQRFDLEIRGRGLEVVIVGTPDVTVFWD